MKKATIQLETLTCPHVCKNRKCGKIFGRSREKV